MKAYVVTDTILNALWLIVFNPHKSPPRWHSVHASFIDEETGRKVRCLPQVAEKTHDRARSYVEEGKPLLGAKPAQLASPATGGQPHTHLLWVIYKVPNSKDSCYIWVFTIRTTGGFTCPAFPYKIWRHQGSTRQLISLIWCSLLSAELGWGPRPMGLWLVKSMICVWFYCTLKANFSPLGNGCGNRTVTLQERASLHLSPNSINYICPGLAHALFSLSRLQAYCSVHEHAQCLAFQEKKNKTKHLQKCDMFLT